MNGKESDLALQIQQVIKHRNDTIEGLQKTVGNQQKQIGDLISSLKTQQNQINQLTLMADANRQIIQSFLPIIIKASPTLTEIITESACQLLNLLKNDNSDSHVIRQISEIIKKIQTTEKPEKFQVIENKE